MPKPDPTTAADNEPMLRYDPDPSASPLTVGLIIFLLAGLGGPILAILLFWLL